VLSDGEFRTASQSTPPALTESARKRSTVNSGGTIGSNGVASLAYTLKKQDPTGTYEVKASSGSTAASTSFTVQ
jgi:hypothetical protein